MKARTLVLAVVLTHVLVIGSVLCMQGCRTKGPVAVEPPPTPVLPPQPGDLPAASARPVFQPPSPVEPAPAVTAPLEGQSYKVQPGDSLSKIAAHAGVSVHELIELNNIKNPNKIRVGQTLVLPDYAKGIPAGKAASPATHAAPKKAQPRGETVKAPEGGSVYVVVAGDSLSKIAVKHGVKLANLRAANKLSSDKILVGQKLIIPGKGSVAATPKPEPQTVKSQVSETSQAAAPAATSMPAPVAQPPQPAVVVPETGTPPAPAAVSSHANVRTPVQPLLYDVSEATTVEDLAKFFVVDVNELMALNNFTSPQQKLSVGQKVLIPAAK
jgi:LysM repeat protein